MNCKVIATSIAPGREVRTRATFPAHNQNNPTSESIMEMLSTIVDYEHKQDAGVPCDIIIVNSSPDGHDFIKSFEGKTRNGHIRTFNRDNIGGSFGAYDFVHKECPEYDYFLLTEDDIVVFGKNYYRNLITTFESYRRMGMLALIDVVENHSLGIHAHGAVGLTKKSVLDDVAKYNGGSLPHHTGAWNKSHVITQGEVPFTRSMHELDYQLDVFSPVKEWSPEKLCVPYYQFKDTL